MRLWVQGNGWKRRVSLIPVRPGEGRLTEPQAATRPWRRNWSSCPFADVGTHLEQTVKQRHCVFQIGSIESLSEPTVDRREEVTGFRAPGLVAAEPGKAHSSTQFPELGLLLAQRRATGLGLANVPAAGN